MHHVFGEVMIPPLALLGDSIGTGELLIIFLVALLLFGPKRLPEVARMLGRITNQLQRAAREFQDRVEHLDEEKIGADAPHKGEGKDSGTSSSPSTASADETKPAEKEPDGRLNQGGHPVVDSKERSNSDHLAG
jgi:sec-independent protein translocase protein TatA